MRGRPRKVGAREPNGRLSRSAAKALERQVQAETRPEGLISPLLLHRLAGNARVEAFGTPVGQLLLFGKLEPAQYSAARSWAKLAARYRLAIEAPDGETSRSTRPVQFVLSPESGRDEKCPSPILRLDGRSETVSQKPPRYEPVDGGDVCRLARVEYIGALA